MDNEALVSLIIALLGILGGTGFWGYRQSRKEAPVKKRDADIAAADLSVQMALAVATAAREHGNTLQEELDGTRERLTKLTGQVEGLEDHVREQNTTISILREALRIWTTAWEDLVNNWSTVRLQKNPPKQPHIQFNDELSH